MIRKFTGTKGQSVVEYILLLSVISTLTLSILKGTGFSNFIGANSPIFAKMRQYIEYTYRHASYEQKDDSNYGRGHDSYYKKGDTRFFTPSDKYPN